MAKPAKVIILGDASDALKALAQVEKAAGQTASRMERVGQRMTSVGKGLTLGLTAPIVAGAVLAVKALGEIEKLSAQTDAAIASTGGVANVTREQIEDLAGSLEDLTSVEAEVIQEGQNLLLTFTKVRNEVGEGNDIFDQATAAALDMSVAMGTDMSAASIMLGKALNDPVKGLTAMTKAGIQFTQAQKDQIIALVEAGDTLGAQKIILAELTTQFGGSAEALGNTMVGKIEKAKNAFGEMTETLASALLPAIEAVTGMLQRMADWFNNLDPAGQKTIGILIAVAAAVGPVLIIMGKLVGAFGIVMKAFTAMSTLMMANPWVLLIAAVIALVTIIVLNWDKIVAFLKKTWDWIKTTASAVGDWISQAFKKAVDFIVGLFLNFTLPGLLIKHWDTIKAGVTAVTDFFRDKWDAVVDFFKGLPARIGSAVAGLWDGIKDGFRAAVNWVIDKWNGIRFKIPKIDTPFGTIGGGEIGVPKIPRLHSGGVFRAPTPGGEGLALLKDRETVLPAGRAGASTVINLSVVSLDPQAAGRAVVEALQSWQRSNGALPITVRSA